MATEQDYRAILIPTEPFRQLKIASYIDRGRKKKLFKGEFIHTNAATVDDPDDYYIDEGEIATMFANESGEGTPVAWRSAGNAFSAEYNGFASIGRYRTRFVAVKNSVVFSFTQRQLYEFAQEDPDIFYEYVYTCHMHFAQMAHRLSNTGYQSSMKRLVMWLQKLCAVHTPNVDGSYTIPCSMTLQRISELLFLHITTLTKLIAVLEADGVITRTRSQIEVHDVARLESYGVDG